MALAARVGLQLWIVAFILFFGTEVVHQEPMLRITAQLLFGIPLAAWALTRLRGRDPMDLPIAVAIGAFLIVSLLGRDPVGSLEAAGLVTAYAVLYRAIRWFAARPAWRETLALGAATGLAATLAINAWLLLSEKLTAINAFHAIPSLEGVQVFPWETVNAMPILVLIAIPFLGWSPPGAVRRLLIGVVVLSGAVVVPISVGRAGWMALGLTAVAYFLVHPGARLPLADLPRALRIGLLGLAGIVAMIVMILAAGAVIRGLGESARLILWQQSAGMVADRPLLGSGPSTYSWARMQYGPQEARLVAVRLTHDVPLQTAIDGGLVLIAGLATLIVGWARQVWIGWAGLGRAQRLGVATLIGFAAASLLDDFSFLPSVMGLVIGIAAYALPAREPDESRGRGPSLIVAVILAAVTLPAVFAGSAARTDAINGRSAALAGDWERAAVDYRAATEARSGLALYWIELGQAEAGRGDATAAGRAYATARDRNPGDPRPPAALAQLSGSHALRVDLLREAADLTIGDPQYAYRLGLELATGGDIAAAANAWGRAVALQPPLIGVLPYEANGIDPDAVVAEALAWIDGHPHPAPIVDAIARWDMGLFTGQLDANAPAAWRAVQAARSGSAAGGRAIAQQAIDESPFDARGYEPHAVAAAFAGDAGLEQEAQRLEALPGNASGAAAPPVATHREFVYRETTLGAMQPPGTPTIPDPGAWPWSLIGPPPECMAPAS